MSSNSPLRSRALWFVLLGIVVFLVGFQMLERMAAPAPKVGEEAAAAPDTPPLVRPEVRQIDDETIEVDFLVEGREPVRFERDGVDIERLVACIQGDVDRAVRARQQDETVDTMFRRMRRQPLRDKVYEIQRRCMRRLASGPG